jgi:hypothetical protein
MKYIGPDYNEAYGIVLPGTDNALNPRIMTDSQIAELLQYYPFLRPYFGAGSNTGGGGGESGNNQFVPIAWWINQAQLTQIIGDWGDFDVIN